MRIGSFDTRDRVLVIAEIGNNHEGDLALAKELIHAAAGSGADAVKFQTIVPRKFVAPDQTARLAMMERFSFSPDQFAELAEEAGRAGTMFLSTPFDLGSVQMLAPLVPAYKIASGDNTFYPLMEAVAATGKPIILSCGLAGIEDVLRARERIQAVWNAKGVAGELAALHCVASYPTPFEEANLLAIKALEAAASTVGYSDHTLGIEAAVLAVAVGARILEKHFTLDHEHSDFRDHQLSATPDELALLVRRVREAESALGAASKEPQACEKGNTAAMRRSIVAGADLAAGAVLSMDDLCWVRPGGGLAPGEEGLLLGKRLKAARSMGQRILAEDVE
ncbi:MAG: N-acetylneuraminate synthase family protein [Desulfovibrionaceae bacterium]|jgi:sialic acid synthase SpsE|nr:N-acetylneuraminate synthase family protein [Desulfovibrionaceae bacterium]